MPKVWILGVTLAFALAGAAVCADDDKLKGLEMDVMQPDQSPDQATATIRLPDRPSGQSNGQGNGQGSGQGNQINGQDLSDVRDSASMSGKRSRSNIAVERAK